MVESAYGNANADCALPMTVDPMKTFPMQHYLDEELVNRLGFENEVFQSGSFQVFNSDGSYATQEEEEESKTGTANLKAKSAMQA